MTDQKKVECYWLKSIEEYRPVEVCPDCGKKIYFLDPGDGLPTHLLDGAKTEMLEEDLEEP